MKEIEISDEDWKVIEKRAEELPDNFHIGILGEVLSKEDLLQNIHDRTALGEAYIRMQLKFIKWAVKRATLSE